VAVGNWIDSPRVCDGSKLIMYYEMIQNKPHFTRAKRGTKVPDGKTHYSIAYRFPDVAEIAWHTQGWPRLGHIIKPIEVTK